MYCCCVPVCVQVSADNTELACAFIQKTAVEKAVPEMDKRLSEVSPLNSTVCVCARTLCAVLCVHVYVCVLCVCVCVVCMCVLRVLCVCVCVCVCVGV